MKTTIKTGDKVRVRLMGSGIVQAGTVVEVRDQTFVWENAARYQRTSKLGQITDAPLNNRHANPMIREWIEETSAED